MSSESSENSENLPVSLLLVEDDAIDVMTVERMLRKQNIANPLFVARDGVEALEMLRGENDRAQVPSPYLILLDLNMPRMNGLEFLAELRKDPAHKNAVVFVLTTSDAPEDRHVAYEHRVAGYIVKDRMGDDLLDLLMIQFARAGRDWTPREVDTGKLLRGAIQKLRVLDQLKVEVASDMPRLRTAGVPLEYVFLTLLGHIARRRRRAGRMDIAWEDTGTHLRFSMLVSGSSRPQTETSKNIRQLLDASPMNGPHAETVGLVVTRNVVESVEGTISMVPSGTACSFTWPREWFERWESAPPLSGGTPLVGAPFEEEDTQTVDPDPPGMSLFQPPEELRELPEPMALTELTELPVDRSSPSLLMILGDAIDPAPIAEALTARGLTNSLHVAGDAEAALALLGDPATSGLRRPYTLLLDLDLPQMNGLELLEALRNDPSSHRAVVFVLTASDAPEDRMAAYEHGVAGYIPLARCADDFSDLAALLDHYWRLNASAPL